MTWSARLFDPSAGLARLPSAGSVPRPGGRRLARRPGVDRRLIDAGPVAHRPRRLARRSASTVRRPAGSPGFPILAERVNGQQLVWFDKQPPPRSHRPSSTGSRTSTATRTPTSTAPRTSWQPGPPTPTRRARKTVARFLGAESEKNIVFVRGATEAINLVAQLGQGEYPSRRRDRRLTPGAPREHRALAAVDRRDGGESYRSLVDGRRPAAAAGVRQAARREDETGGRPPGVERARRTVTPIDAVVEMAHRAGACVLIDGAQSVPHLRVWTCRPWVPTSSSSINHRSTQRGRPGSVCCMGLEVLESMPPWGGNVIADVTFERTNNLAHPARFEAVQPTSPTPSGWAPLSTTITRIGLETIAQYEHSLLAVQHRGCRRYPGARGRHRPGQGQRVVVRPGRLPDRGGRGRPEPARHRGAPDTTARSRSCGGSAWRRPCVRRSPSTTPPRRSTGWWPCCIGWRRIGAVADSSGGSGVRSRWPGGWPPVAGVRAARSSANARNSAPAHRPGSGCRPSSPPRSSGVGDPARPARSHRS